ncbi:MAG: signal peptidase II [Candidatus Omnitrophota bacterium]
MQNFALNARNKKIKRSSNSVIITAYALIATILFLDQVSKYLVIKYIGLNANFVIINKAFFITPILNTGGGFGILPGETPIFILASFLTIICIVFVLLKRNNRELIFLYSVSMILAGALGNLIDRLRFGAVVDFLDFRIWPVFNIADSAITIGAVFLIWHLLKSPRRLKPACRQAGIKVKG